MTEHELHKAVAQYLRLVLRPPVYWTTIDHGAGKMSPASAGKAKARGVKAGLPDILVFAPAEFRQRPVMSEKHPGRYKNPLEWGPAEPTASRVIAIELKSAKGRMAPVQKETHASLSAAGAQCFVARSIDEVRGILLANGLPVHAQLDQGAVAHIQARAA